MSFPKQGDLLHNLTSADKVVLIIVAHVLYIRAAYFLKLRRNNAAFIATMSGGVILPVLLLLR